jgi:hypothetical protein
MCSPEPGQASLASVEFPVTAFFRHTVNVQVPTAAAMDAKWIDADARGPPIPMLGPYENTDADTRRTLCMRYAIRVPQKYLPMVLGMQYQPRQLYDEELIITIRANGEEANGLVRPAGMDSEPPADCCGHDQ